MIKVRNGLNGIDEYKDCKALIKSLKDWAEHNSQGVFLEVEEDDRLIFLTYYYDDAPRHDTVSVIVKDELYNVNIGSLIEQLRDITPERGLWG